MVEGPIFSPSVSISILTSNHHIFMIFNACICDKIECAILQDVKFFCSGIWLCGYQPRFQQEI